jgi:hypothetical protein
MPFTLPTFTKSIDTAFTTTWYSIKPEAQDNILLATPVWAALKMKGCFKTQVGGNMITETIRYVAGPTPTAVKKGSVLPSGEIEFKTMAIWTFRFVATHIQRNIFDDRENQGKDKITDYVSDRLGLARDGMVQKFETDVLRAHVTDESGMEIQALNDIVPPLATATTGTYGGINRPTAYATTNGTSVPSTGNTWWGPKYHAGTDSLEVNLRADMTHLFNVLDGNQNKQPDLIVTTQEMFEAYEEFAADKSMIVKDATTQLADLGFGVLRFKGKPLVWTPNMTAKNMLMLYTPVIKFIYDPTMWFDMTEWKQTEATGGDKLAHILCAGNMTTKEPRRHGRLSYT